MRSGYRVALGSAVLVIGGIVPAGTSASTRPIDVDRVIVTEARQLSAEEVRRHDITDTAAGRLALEAERKDGSFATDRRPVRVFAFGRERVIVDAKSPLLVRAGRNTARAKVFDVVPAARPVRAAVGAGYVVPPDSAWGYNTDGAFVTTLGTWKQSVFWTINAAWNHRACGSCTPYQYFRIYGKMQAATLTGAGQYDGFRRAWLEFDNDGAWGGAPASFEVGEPEESYAGTDGITFSVGFGQGFSIGLGVPPFTIGGRADSSYGGSMTRHNENWHPVVRTELASGGVQWCRYDMSEFTGSKVIATRVGIRQAINAPLGGWYILKGMEDFTSRCPTWI
jgi:hypothetical protein